MTISNVNLDLSSPEFKKNAYKIYKELRENEPIHEITIPDGQRAWLVTRYDDAVQTLKDDDRFTKNLRTVSDVYTPVLPQKESDLLTVHMLTSDPPDHTRLRSIVSKAFSSQMIEGMQDEIQGIANSLIDQIVEKGSMEAIADFAFPLPIIVISKMLGIPEDEHYLIKKWSNDYIAAANNREKLKEAFPSIQAFGNYIDALIVERRKNPGNDLISMLIQAHDSGDKLTASELSSTIWLLIVAGHETTVNLIGNGLLALLENPDQLRLWQNDPALVPTGIEELLRYHSPVEIGTNRWAVRDFTWHGKEVRRGDMIFVGLASANRDPEQFENPDQLDITRTKNRHIAFGNGIHFCLGAPLARMEGKIALSTLLRRLPNLRLDSASDAIEWRPSILMRGLERLSATF